MAEPGGKNSDDAGSKKTTADNGGASGRRVELVAAANPTRSESARTGVGLLVGFFVGRQSLFAAASGSEQFEWAIAHFIAVVLVSVGGVLLLGTFLDRILAGLENDESDGDDDATTDPDSNTEDEALTEPTAAPTAGFDPLTTVS